MRSAVPPRPRRIRFLCRIATWLASLVVLASARAQDSCIGCHGKEAELEQGRPHHRAAIGCTECHGGDAQASTKEAAKAAGTGYRGVLGRETWPGLCGDCHADVRRMNPFGIPTDQLARYRTSHHGEAFFDKSDPKVATCVDCHGSHGVLGPSSAESPVHPKRVPDTCGKCHADPEIVAEYELEGREKDDYLASVHWKLLHDGDLSAPQCATCHGNHGAVPPGFAAVGSVCGKCHERQRELFDKSPHARLVATGEFEACVACHGNHRVQPAGEHILERTCNLCHEAGDRGATARDRLLLLLRSTAAELEQTRAELTLARQHGHAEEQDLLLLENARTALTEMRAVQHSLDPEQLERTAREATSNLARVRERVQAAAALERTKRLMLVPVVVFLGLMSFGFWVRYRRIHRPSGSQSHG